MLYKYISFNLKTLTCRLSVLICLVSAVIALSSTSAYAVSAGCTAVRGGALNVTANDLVPDFNGNFEAGETIVWTFTGSAIQQEVSVTPPGGNLAIVGGQATFTFPTTGAFTIAESVSGTVTATCQETTAEKQTAVQAAVKTLTEMQLLHSTSFQGQLLQELANAFLAGSSSAALSREAQGVISNLENRREFLLSKIAKERELLNGQNAAFAGFRKQHEQIVAAYNAQIKKRDDAKHRIWFIENKTIWPEYQNALKIDERLKGEMEFHQGQQGFWYGERQKHNSVLNDHQDYDNRRSDYMHPTDYAKVREAWRNADEKERFHNKRIREVLSESNQNMFLYRSGVRAEIAMKLKEQFETAKQNLADANQALSNLEQSHAEAVGVISNLNADLQKIQGRVNGNIAKYQTEINSINAEITRIRSGIGTVDSRIRSSTTPFQETHFQRTESSTNPFTLNGARSGHVNFFADLNRLRRQVLEARANLTGQTDISANNNPNYNIWIKGNYSHFESNQSGAEQEGESYAFATGTYYSFTPRFMAGVMYRYRYADSESTAQGSDLETKGHGVGVHTTYRFTPTFSFSGQALYERSDNDLVRNGTTGAYDADNITTSGTFQGMLNYQGVTITPSIGLTYAYVKTERFTDSAGTNHAGQTTKQLQLIFGPSFSYKEYLEDDSIKYVQPSLSISGVYSLKDEGDTTLASGTIIRQDSLSLQLSGGISILLENDAELSLNGNFSGLGASKVESYGVGGKYNYKF